MDNVVHVEMKKLRGKGRKGCVRKGNREGVEDGVKGKGKGGVRKGGADGRSWTAEDKD